MDKLSYGSNKSDNSTLKLRKNNLYDNNQELNSITKINNTLKQFNPEIINDIKKKVFIIGYSGLDEYKKICDLFTNLVTFGNLNNFIVENQKYYYYDKLNIIGNDDIHIFCEIIYQMNFFEKLKINKIRVVPSNKKFITVSQILINQTVDFCYLLIINQKFRNQILSSCSLRNISGTYFSYLYEILISLKIDVLTSQPLFLNKITNLINIYNDDPNNDEKYIDIYEFMKNLIIEKLKLEQINKILESDIHTKKITIEDNTIYYPADSENYGKRSNFSFEFEWLDINDFPKVRNGEYTIDWSKSNDIICFKETKFKIRNPNREKEYTNLYLHNCNEIIKFILDTNFFKYRGENLFNQNDKIKIKKLLFDFDKDSNFKHHNIKEIHSIVFEYEEILKQKLLLETILNHIIGNFQTDTVILVHQSYSLGIKSVVSMYFNNIQMIYSYKNIEDYSLDLTDCLVNDSKQTDLDSFCTSLKQGHCNVCYQKTQKFCPICKNTFYCSKKCQKEDYKYHKGYCKK